MKSRHMIAAAALALMGAAASASPSEFTDMPSTASRAEVLAEARADARGFRANDSYGSVDSTSLASSTTSREEVLAELAAARASGELDVRGEVYGDLGNTKFGNLPAASTVVAAAEPDLILAYADTSVVASPSAADDGILVITESADGQVIDEAAETTLLSEPLSEPIMPVDDATPPNAAILQSSVTEPVVLWVPIDGEAVTLRPGEAVLLVPSNDAEVPNAE